MGLELINIWAILVAGIVKFMIGATWYAPKVFGNVWMREIGLKQEDLKDPKIPVLITAILGLLTAFSLAVVMALAGVSGISAVALSLVIAIGIVCTMISQGFLFDGRSFRLYMIYGGHYAVEIVVMGAIIGFWPF